MTGLSSLLRLLVLPARLLDRILIAWKSITEARRVVAVVLPLLKRTKDVTIVEMRATKSKASRDGSFDVVIWLATLGRPKETSVAIQKLIDLASQEGGQNSARIASLKFQLADAQIAAGEFDRALALLRDAKQALASAVSPGLCRTRNRPFPDRLAASRRRVRLRVPDNRRDRRVTCAQAAPAGSSAKPTPEKNTHHFSLRGNTMRAPGVEQYACRS